MTTIPVTFNRIATYSEERRAEVDAHEYTEWCFENGHDSTDLDSLRTYILTDFCGDIEEREGYCEDSEFSDFDNADYARMLTAAAAAAPTMRPDEELRQIARGEVHRHGTRGRGVEALQADRGLTEAEARHVLTLMQLASITLP